MQNAVAAHTFRKRPANCEANASLRWSWSIRPANTASDLATWPFDGGYGKDPAFLRGLETRSLCFLADVHKHQRIWLDDPAPYRPATTSRGRPCIDPAHRPARADRGRMGGAAAGLCLEADQTAPGRERHAEGGVSARSGYGHGIARKKPHATGICWCAGNVGADTPSHFVFSNADASTSLSRSGTHARLPLLHRARLPGRPRASWPWRIIRCVAGMPGIATWRWSWLPCCFCSRSA